MFDDSFRSLIQSFFLKYQAQKAWFKSFKNELELLPELHPQYWKGQRLIQRLPAPKQINQHLSVVGVDGGLVTHELRFLDLIITRAVAVQFKGLTKTIKANYLPSETPSPSIEVFSSFENRQDLLRTATLKRLIAEYQALEQAITEFHPDIAFLDGSLVPMRHDLLQNVNPLTQSVQTKLIDTYQSLISTIQSSQTQVIGIVKDSRSNLFLNALRTQIRYWLRQSTEIKPLVNGFNNILAEGLDVQLTNYLLDQGYQTQWLKSEVPKQINSMKMDLFVSYAQTTASDLPIRLEMLSDGSKGIDLALQGFYYLTQHGLPTNLPSVIIEADQRVKIDYRNIEDAITNIALELQIPLHQLKKRRDS